MSGELADAGERFDVVLSNHVLHHLDGPRLGALLADSERLLAPGGVAVHGDIARSPLALRRILGGHAAVRVQPPRGVVHPRRRTDLQVCATSSAIIVMFCQLTWFRWVYGAFPGRSNA